MIDPKSEVKRFGSTQMFEVVSELIFTIKITRDRDGKFWWRVSDGKSEVLCDSPSDSFEQAKINALVGAQFAAASAQVEMVRRGRPKASQDKATGKWHVILFFSDRIVDTGLEYDTQEAAEEFIKRCST